MSARECPGCGMASPPVADPNAAAIGEHVARRLNCATIHDVPDVLRRVLASNADVATYMRQRDEVEGSARLDRERADALRVENARQRTRAEAAEAEVARLTTEREGLYRAASHARQERTLMAEELATVREERDALRETVADLTERMEDAHDGGEVDACAAIVASVATGGR